MAKKDINNEMEILPAPVTGFRRWLMAMYCHTGAHIVAAPMAHYMALYGSRFRYSHRTGYFPVHGIENFILGKKTIMQFKTIKNKKVPVHRCMNYIYRPAKLEGLSTYEFWAKIFETRLPKRGRKKEHEEMEYTKEHPGYKVFTLQTNQEDIIPYFAWNFLPSTAPFTTSVQHPVNVTDIDYEQKEDYCRRFLILFVPFRKHEDLLKEGNYTLRMQEAIKKNEIKEEMIHIANNIQTIHNSLNSPMVENILTGNTILEEPDGCERDEGDNTKEANDILLRIGTSLASSMGDMLKEESKDINPIFGKQKTYNRDIDTFGVIPDAFDIEGEQINGTSGSQSNVYTGERFSVNTSILNKLVMKTFLSSKDMEKKMTTGEEEHQEGKTYQVEATGTWQSIIEWGRANGLDEDQQTAFEILSATFVLSFHNGKTDDVPASNEAKDQYDALRNLARKKEEENKNTILGVNKAAIYQVEKKGNATILSEEETSTKPNETKRNNEPLRLFITGPAGAGKCK
jgi:hypothetical protein